MEVKVSKAVAVPFGGRVNVAREQVISSDAGIPQLGEERAPEPLSPLWLVNVSVVETDFPGEEMVRAVGVAETEYQGVSVTNWVTDPLDAA